MPTISKFYGIVIRMYFDDHVPPHFHAMYQGFEAIYTISPFSIYEGGLPSRANRLVREWARLHRDELMEDWEAAVELRSLKKIAPLV